jgi:hypothetical protein
MMDARGETQDDGEAVWIKDARWEDETLTEGKVLVEAFDLAGNVTRYEA